MKKSTPSHYWLLAALCSAMALGLWAHNYSDSQLIQFVSQQLFAPLGQIFLRLIFMIVVPMVFAGLIIGVYQLGVGHGQGLAVAVRRTIFFTLLTSSASVLLGIGLVNTIKPGEGIHIDQTLLEQQQEQVATIAANAQKAKSFSQTLIDFIPKNPLDSAVKALDGEMIALMLFALIFALAYVRVYPSASEEEGMKQPLMALLEQIYQTSMAVVHFAMKLAPFAVFALVFNTTSKFGPQLLLSLVVYVMVVVAGLLLQQFVTYSILLKVVKGLNPLVFFSQCKEVYLYAFATASSNATLPRSLETAEKKLGISPAIARFVLTVGSTANQNGTALFEGVTVLFLAQVYGISLDLTQQIQVVFMSILAGIGTAGVPGGSLPLVAILLQQIGVPVEGLGLILGVDRLLDMCRTTINVSGDLVIASLVDREHNNKKLLLAASTNS